MSFYLKPPRGEANLHTVVKCVQQRIYCYNLLENGNDVKDINDFEYLVEGSILDRTSHFIFRLAVLRGYLPIKVFLDNELRLLKQRLEYYDKDDMKIFLRNIIRQLKDCIHLNIEEALSEFYCTLYDIINTMLEKEYLSHIFKKHIEENINSDCSDGLWISIPFWYCNDYVALREVNLKNGKALFHCGKWRDIISTLFNSYLTIALNEMKYSKNVATTLADNRILGCLQLLKNQYCKNSNHSGIRMTLKNMEDESIYFPLCMKNLFDSLRKNHRLTHNERFDFSLFLKGIGLSLNDSIKFWQDEYSLQHSACSKCSHTWQQNEAKYVYSIKHLYGLEGSRKNYSIRSCQNLQSSGLGINCEGGCPYVHYDDDHLRSTLKRNLPSLDDDIEVIIFERKENATFACKLYSESILKQLKHNILERNTSFENPLQFFRLIRDEKTISR